MCTQNGPLNLEFHKVNHRIVSWQEGAALASNFTSLQSGLLSFAGGRDIGHLEIIISSFHLEPFWVYFKGRFFAVYWEYVYAQKAFQALNWFRLKLLAPQKKTKAKTVFPVEKWPMKREHKNQCKNMQTLTFSTFFEVPSVCWTYRGCRQRGLWHRHVMKPQKRSVAFERMFPKWWDLDCCKFALEVNWFFQFPKDLPVNMWYFFKNISHHCQKNWKFLLVQGTWRLVFYQPRSGKSLSEMRYPVRTLRSWIRS